MAEYLETKVVEAGGTRWIAVRARGAEWSYLTPQEIAQLAKDHAPTAPEAAPASETFGTVREGNDILLCVEQSNGAVVSLATFINEECCRRFNAALAQNWKAAHAMGHLGF